MLSRGGRGGVRLDRKRDAERNVSYQHLQLKFGLKCRLFASLLSAHNLHLDAVARFEDRRELVAGVRLRGAASARRRLMEP